MTAVQRYIFDALRERAAAAINTLRCQAHRRYFSTPRRATHARATWLHHFSAAGALRFLSVDWRYNGPYYRVKQRTTFTYYMARMYCYIAFITCWMFISGPLRRHLFYQPKLSALRYARDYYDWRCRRVDQEERLILIFLYAIDETGNFTESDIMGAWAILQKSQQMSHNKLCREMSKRDIS